MLLNRDGHRAFSKVDEFFEDIRANDWSKHIKIKTVFKIIHHLMNQGEPCSNDRPAILYVGIVIFFSKEKKLSLQ